MRNRIAMLFSMISACFALMVSACTTDNMPAAAAGDTSVSKETTSTKYDIKKGALKIDPLTQAVQTCVPPFDPNCTALGPDDQLTCLPNGKCEYYSSDNNSTYRDPFDPNSTNTFTYISCAGSGSTDDDDYCLSQNPYQNKKDYVSVCIVTEKTSQSLGEAGRCAYFYKACTMGLGTPCAVTGYTLPCSNTVCSCSAAADLSKAVTESCNSVDDNCDGATDEANAIGCTKFYTDADGDGYGSNQSTPYCLCGTQTGMSDNDYDCNDNNSSVHPNANEVCNEVDDNCDGQIDENTKITFYADADSDGYGNISSATEACSAPQGYVASNTDCNDGVASVNPGATEVCNSVDDNCDGQIDENVKNTYYVDADADTYGNVNYSVLACTAPQGYVADKTDCNDGVASVNPGATEVCNGVDDDCDGMTDESVKLTFYKDVDSDTYGDNGSTTAACSAPTGYVSDNTDCNDSVASVHPGATEVCNGVDDDCDNNTDEDVKTPFYADTDGDSFGNTNSSTLACIAPQGYVADKTDCNDSAASVHPGATDGCNQIDDNCDGLTDIDPQGNPVCDLACPTVKKYSCNQEYTIDRSTLTGASTINSYSCWTAAGVKNIGTNFVSQELMLAPSVANGTKFSFQMTAGTSALATLLHGTCEPNQGTTNVTAYNPANGLNGTCAAASTTSVGGVAGSDYVAVDWKVATATGSFKFKFVCAP